MKPIESPLRGALKKGKATMAELKSTEVEKRPFNPSTSVAATKGTNNTEKFRTEFTGVSGFWGKNSLNFRFFANFCANPRGTNGGGDAPLAPEPFPRPRPAGGPGPLGSNVRPFIFAFKSHKYGRNSAFKNHGMQCPESPPCLHCPCRRGGANFCCPDVLLFPFPTKFHEEPNFHNLAQKTQSRACVAEVRPRRRHDSIGLPRGV